MDVTTTSGNPVDDSGIGLRLPTRRIETVDDLGRVLAIYVRRQLGVERFVFSGVEVCTETALAPNWFMPLVVGHAQDVHAQLCEGLEEIPFPLQLVDVGDESSPIGMCVVAEQGLQSRPLTHLLASLAYSVREIVNECRLAMSVQGEAIDIGEYIMRFRANLDNIDGTTPQRVKRADRKQ